MMKTNDEMSQVSDRKGIKTEIKDEFNWATQSWIKEELESKIKSMSQNNSKSLSKDKQYKINWLTTKVILSIYTILTWIWNLW